MARTIVITSGKGGVGKTTSAVNIAAGFNKLGKNVVLIDANITTPNVGLHLGAPAVPISLNHVLSGKAKLQDAIYEHHSGMKVMPSAISFSALRGVRPEKLEEITRQLKRIADITIIDSAAGLGREAVVAIKSSDDVIIITNAELAALTDALKTIRLSEQLDKNIKGVVVTRFRNDNHQMNLEEVESMLETQIIAVIPEDDAVRESQRMKDAVVHTHPHSNAARSYMELTARLLGKKYIEELEEKQRRGALHRLLVKLGIAK